MDIGINEIIDKAINPEREWEPIPGESAKAFAAFMRYRDMGPGRSVNSAWRAAYPDKSKCAGSQWNKWAVDWNWKFRALEYDKYNDRLARKTRDAELREVIRRLEQEKLADRIEKLDISRKLMDRANLMLKHPISKITSTDEHTIVEPARWTTSDITTFIRVAQQLKRDAFEGIDDELPAYVTRRNSQSDTSAYDNLTVPQTSRIIDFLNNALKPHDDAEQQADHYASLLAIDATLCDHNNSEE